MTRWSDVPKTELRRILGKHSPEVCDDHRRCEGLLRDYCPSYPKETRLLVFALRLGVPERLRRLAGSAPLELLLPQMTQRLQSGFAMTPDAAQWAVHAWAYALGLTEDREQPASEAKPAPARRLAPTAEQPAKKDPPKKGAPAKVRPSPSRKKPSPSIVLALTQRGRLARTDDKGVGQLTGESRAAAGAVAVEWGRSVFGLHATRGQRLLAFTNLGRALGLPAAQARSLGQRRRKLPPSGPFSLQSGEYIVAALAIPSQQVEGFLLLATGGGRIKRMAVDEVSGASDLGLKSISLDDDDHLCWVRHTRGQDDVIVVTRWGLACRFPEEEVRVVKRQAYGAKLFSWEQHGEAGSDCIAALDAIRPELLAGDKSQGDKSQGDKSRQGELLVVTERGHARRVSLEWIPRQPFSGGGIPLLVEEAIEQTGLVAGARVLMGDISRLGQLILVNRRSQELRLPVGKVHPYKSAQVVGRQVVALAEDDAVVDIALDSDEAPASNIRQLALPAPTKGPTRPVKQAGLDLQARPATRTKAKAGVPPEPAEPEARSSNGQVAGTLWTMAKVGCALIILLAVCFILFGLLNG